MASRFTELSRKTIKIAREGGLRETLIRAYKYAFNPDPLPKLIRQNKGKDMSPIFAYIYEQNLWKDDESRSGPGSNLESTANIRRELPKIIENLSLKSIFDAPCGDFYWMKEVAFPDGFQYIGADIVAPLIEANRRAFEGPTRTFLTLDITRDLHPPTDLFFCRDCLFHLSTADINKVFANFLRSGTPYLMTTTHIDTGPLVNTEINSGEFRHINLFKPPFNLPPNVLARVDDYHLGIVPREMCVWSREQIAQACN